MDLATPKQVEEYRNNNTRINTKIDLSGKRILVVEDNNLNMVIMDRILSNQGVITSKAKNGLEALNLVESTEEGFFDAIVMDVRMPVMDGLKATKKIRQLDRFDVENIPIIAITANAFEEDRRAAREAGMTDFLTQPVEPKLLLETLQKYVD